MLCEADRKLVYYVGLPPRLFDPAESPQELQDPVADGTGQQVAAPLARHLRKIGDADDLDGYEPDKLEEWFERKIAIVSKYADVELSGNDLSSQGYNTCFQCKLGDRTWQSGDLGL